MLKQKDSLLTFAIKLTVDNIKKDCLLVYRPVNKSLSILEPKTHKTLIPDNQLQLLDHHLIVQQLVAGKHIPILINSEQKASVEIVSYCDEFTKSTFTKQTVNPSSVLFMLKPGFIESKKLGQIFSLIQKDFQILRFKMFKLNKHNLSQYIVNQKMQNQQNDHQNIDYLVSGPCFAFEINGDKLLPRLRKILGPQNPIEAKKNQPLSLRAKHGTNIIENCCHSSKTQQSAQKELQFIFSSQVQQLKPQLKETCLCLIKPHIVQDKKTGQIVTALLQNQVEINCMRFERLKPELVKKYLDLYKFLPEYEQNIRHFNEDKCLYMEIRVGKGKNVVEDFKKICGPYDPSYAKKIVPNSLRAIFGVDRVHNAVHSTELYEDSESELKIIFQC